MKRPAAQRSGPAVGPNGLSYIYNVKHGGLVYERAFPRVNGSPDTQRPAPTGIPGRLV